MKRTAMPPRRQPMSRTGRVPTQRQAVASMAESQARAVVLARSGGVCEWHGTHGGTDWSHRLHRSHGGPWTPSNGLWLCHSLHMALHSQYRAAAESAGLFLRDGADWDATPVWLPANGWVLLGPGGEIDELGPDWGPAPVVPWD
jgi:hypothetical protein